jgi:hypothetical protein
MTIAVALLVCIVGALLALIPNRASHLGELAFAVGLFWVLAATGGHVAHFGP